MKKFIAIFLSMLLLVQLAACAGKTPETTEATTTEAETTTEAVTTKEETTEEETTEETTPEETTEAEPDPMDVYKDSEFAPMVLGHYTYGKDYESLYESFGRDITIADVIEDPETGFAYIEVNGKRYELGLDFLSMAMVGNTQPAGDYKTKEDVYAAWWRLYVTRWNYLLPEIPLYTNEYLCVYNKKLSGIDKHPVTASWSVLDALVEWSSSNGSIIIGNTTKAAGQFRYASYGNAATNVADKEIGQLLSGLETVSRTKDAGYTWNDTVVKQHTETLNEDGSVTYTITLWDDLKFSDGSAITAKDYLAFPMVFFSPLGEAASGRQDSGAIYLGWEDYLAYTGPGAEGGSKVFTGFHLIDEYTFSQTVKKEYLPSFYDLAMISLQPYYASMWLGNAEIKDDGEGCYLTDDFYAKNESGAYVTAAQIKTAATDTSGKAYAEYPYSGPYFLLSFDTKSGEAVLSRNIYFKGNYEGTKPSIGKVTYKVLDAEGEMVAMSNGSLDFVGGISGDSAIAEAQKNVERFSSRLDSFTYIRAGYGKIGFRCDYGPVQFTEVRRALAYLLDRSDIASDFTGKHGKAVDGPYYEGAWMYRSAVAQGMKLNAYKPSEQEAIRLLEEGGWVYDRSGAAYSSGVRYKRIPAEVISDNDKNISSPDDKYIVTKVGDYYYMPLVINWFGTTPSDFTDFLGPYLKSNSSLSRCGFFLNGSLGSIETLQEELYQQPVYGNYSGSPSYSAFVFSTKLEAAMYDYSYNLTINPALFADYSCYFLKDAADIHWLGEEEEVPEASEESTEESVDETLPEETAEETKNET
ncbi:MAG: hypothetical protein IJL47_08260 [Lachnospiraceae bacterium]|nr:hypothetical protein [Lachnospiraceae bacterium]